MSSSIVCSGFSKSTTCDRAAGTLQHPNTAHTSAHNPRSHRNRLREQGQIIDCLWSSLRFEYAHHQTRFSHSPFRNLSLAPALEKKASAKMFTRDNPLFHPRRIFPTPPNLPTPPSLSTPLNLPTPLRTVIPSGA